MNPPFFPGATAHYNIFGGGPQSSRGLLQGGTTFTLRKGVPLSLSLRYLDASAAQQITEHAINWDGTKPGLEALTAGIDTFVRTAQRKQSLGIYSVSCMARYTPSDLSDEIDIGIEVYAFFIDTIDLELRISSTRKTGVTTLSTTSWTGVYPQLYSKAITTNSCAVRITNGSYSAALGSVDAKFGSTFVTNNPGYTTKADFEAAAAPALATVNYPSIVWTYPGDDGLTFSYASGAVKSIDELLAALAALESTGSAASSPPVVPIIPPPVSVVPPPVVVPVPADDSALRAAVASLGTQVSRLQFDISSMVNATARTSDLVTLNENVSVVNNNQLVLDAKLLILRDLILNQKLTVPQPDLLTNFGIAFLASAAVSTVSK